METIFGLDSTIIAKALKKGILIKVEETFEPQMGILSLVYHPQLARYVLVFGTSAQNAGFVLLEDYQRMWKIQE